MKKIRGSICCMPSGRLTSKVFINAQGWIFDNARSVQFLKFNSRYLMQNGFVLRVQNAPKCRPITQPSSFWWSVTDSFLKALISERHPASLLPFDNRNALSQPFVPLFLFSRHFCFLR